MASLFEPRVPVAAELRVVAIRVRVVEMAGEMEAITVEMVEAEEETAAVVTGATAVAEMVVVEATVAEEAVADTATTVERTIRVVVTVMVTEGTGTIDRNPLL
jgi:hypothetical protein